MRKKESPGQYIPYSVVEQELIEYAYGTTDLIDLGYFKSIHYIREAVNSGQLEVKIINQRDWFFMREDILKYWKKYRDPKKKERTNLLNSIRANDEDLDYLERTVPDGKLDQLFSYMISVLRNYQVIEMGLKTHLGAS